MRNGTQTLERVLKEAGLVEKWKAEGKAGGEGKRALEIAQNLIQKGWSAGDVAETTKLRLRKVRSLYGGRQKEKNHAG